MRIFRSVTRHQTCWNGIAAGWTHPTAVERSDETRNKQKNTSRHCAHLNSSPQSKNSVYDETSFLVEGAMGPRFRELATNCRRGRLHSVSSAYGDPSKARDPSFGVK